MAGVGVSCSEAFCGISGTAQIAVLLKRCLRIPARTGAVGGEPLADLAGEPFDHVVSLRRAAPVKGNVGCEGTRTADRRHGRSIASVTHGGFDL